MMSERMSPAIDFFQIKSSQEDISYNYLNRAHVYLSYRHAVCIVRTTCA